ncbi:hypothetical protein L596_029971 [Steinernema carpocapsae]|uniref:Phlebovirus glycoprotein G2 fusion domain-containing protein n=1 Tax=Steinernema carpocapsae TaxID=34508 RepID=A0A4U5LRD2_STECR|nr:hypothetical protein L596_029971 [Steinernema carpocapsae]
MEYLQERRYYSCKSDFSSTTALVECPSGSFNIICTNPEKEASTTVYMAAPKIDEMCAIRCPAHVSLAHLQGHLVHLNDNAGSAAWIKETADINHSSSFVDFILDMSLSSLLKLICLLISLFGLFNASKAIIPRLVSLFIH